MEATLMLSQTVFYLVVSAAIIVAGILSAIVAYHLVRIAKELEAISHNVREMSDDAEERIRAIVEQLSELPILSWFLRRRRMGSGEHIKKGRKASHTK